MLVKRWNGKKSHKNDHFKTLFGRSVSGKEHCLLNPCFTVHAHIHRIFLHVCVCSHF